MGGWQSAAGGWRSAVGMKRKRLEKSIWRNPGGETDQLAARILSNKFIIQGLFAPTADCHPPAADFSSAYCLLVSTTRPARSEARGKLGMTRKVMRQSVTRSPTRTGAAPASGLVRVTMTGTPRRRSGVSEIS